MNYFISDLHLGHKNCLAFDNRPFTDINIHDNTIIENWNTRVTNNDDVYILGDVSWYRHDQTYDIIKRLNGKLHLIAGNHDDVILKNKDICELFVEICSYKELYVSKKKAIVLCHYPIPCFRNHYYGWIHLYGHVHNSFEFNMMEHVKQEMETSYTIPCHMFNVGAMMPWIDYTPRTVDDIMSYFKIEEENTNK